MLINLRNALMTGKRLPYDAEVEYLESTGTQYIDTGVYSSGGMVRYELDFRPSSAKSQNGVNQGYFGLSNSGSRWFGVAYTIFRNRGLGIGLGQDVIWSGMTAIDRYVVAVSASSATVNGEDVGTPGRVDVARAGNLYLFAVNCVDESGVSSVTPQDCKVYGLKIYGSGGVLVRDYIPVRKGTVGYLYDRVTRKLFGNAGTGDFVLGPDVVPVEYIESHGTEYIDTGISSSEGVCTEAKFKINTITSLNQAVFGKVGVTSGSATRYFFGIQSSSSGLFYYAFNDIYQTNKQQDTNTHTVLFDSVNNILTLDDNSWTLSGDLRTNEETIYLFGANYKNANNNPMSGRIYYTKVYDNSASVRSFCPVRVGSGSTWEGAMMDVLTRRIYRNAGTGAFTWGNDLRYPIPAE